VVKYLEGKAYAMWVVIEPDENSYYALERSADNINYETIHLKKGFKSPHNIELLNSFIDENPLSGTSYYRMKRLTLDKPVTSEVIVINHHSERKCEIKSTLLVKRM